MFLRCHAFLVSGWSRSGHSDDGEWTFAIDVWTHSAPLDPE